MRLSVTLVAGALAALFTLPATAQVRPMSVEVNPYAGFWEGDETLESGATFGVRAQYNITRVFGVELGYGAVTSKLSEDSDGDSTTSGDTEKDQIVHQLGLNGVLHLAGGAFVPFLRAGVGMVAVEDNHFATDIGLGAKYFFTDMIGARVDLTGWFSGDAPAEDRYSHFELTGGVVFQFGGDTDMDDDGVPNRDDLCPTQAEDKDEFEDADGCPEDDNDKDGVLDADDKCPNEAEDEDGDRDEDGCPDVDADGDGVSNENDKCEGEKEDRDGFEDEDGCPDPDNDQDGILDGKDKCPLKAENKNGYEDEDGCPEDVPDLDNDGLSGDADKCPEEAEDKDGFQDEDGCPEPDNDKDGILDAEDKCPTEPETINGNDDEDGCPDEGEARVRIAEGKIEILDKVFFKSGTAEIEEKSFAVLNQVAALLKANAFIKNVEIQGHTDSMGDAKFNQDLSQKRAEAVRDYLVEKGVAGERLAAKGYGPDKPIADNETNKGRATNRRVEFVIGDK